MQVQSSGLIKPKDYDELMPRGPDLIAGADALFIVSCVREGSNAPLEGVDVNHRANQCGAWSKGAFLNRSRVATRTPLTISNAPTH